RSGAWWMRPAPIWCNAGHASCASRGKAATSPNGMESAPFPRASPAYAPPVMRAAVVPCANHRKQIMPSVANTRRQAARLTAALAGVAPALCCALEAPQPSKGDTAWMLTATALVLLMSVPALALFYGGLERTKNMLSVLMQVFVGFS